MSADSRNREGFEESRPAKYFTGNRAALLPLSEKTLDDCIGFSQRN